jgi:hypothetical protein
MKAPGFSESVVNFCQTTCQQIAGDTVLHILFFIHSSIPFTGSNSMAHLMAWALFVWVEDVYRPVFVMGVMDWLYWNVVRLSNSDICCVCVESFSWRNGSIPFFSVAWARDVFICHSSETVH